MTSPTTAWALGYAQDRGWPVFPTRLVKRPNGKVDKVPLVKWGTEASRDPAQIEAWWRKWPDAAISIPTGRRSGIIILDIDIRNDRNGLDTLADLDIGLAILPDTPIAHTPSGGLHVYFGCIGIEIRNSAGTKGLGAGLDIRGDGGQAVLPSPNSGYWWDPHCNFDTVTPVPAPAWLGHRQKPDRPHREGRRLAPATILNAACENIRHAGNGERHDGVTAFAATPTTATSMFAAAAPAIG
jgi:hypothetical protein